MTKELSQEEKVFVKEFYTKDAPDNERYVVFANGIKISLPDGYRFHDKEVTITGIIKEDETPIEEVTDKVN